MGKPAGDIQWRPASDSSRKWILAEAELVINFRRKFITD
ncbi:hypothetical protein D3OALGA1CA_97 [Olavius algarvensis associated proteobacterium Delta 3]|nr:hypothetical protein D3OALGA1CA_97 [Olavius algarvensis associated proteobacterium Delta 3]